MTIQLTLLFTTIKFNYCCILKILQFYECLCVKLLMEHNLRPIFVSNKFFIHNQKLTSEDFETVCALLLVEGHLNADLAVASLSKGVYMWLYSGPERRQLAHSLNLSFSLLQQASSSCLLLSGVLS